MAPPDNPHDEPEIEPMTPEHFDIAVAEIRFTRAGLLEGCRAILVHGKRTTEVVEEFDIPQPQLSRAVARIQNKWQQLCDRENLVSRTVVLSPQAMAVVAELENQFIAPLKKRSQPKKPKNKSNEI